MKRRSFLSLLLAWPLACFRRKPKSRPARGGADAILAEARYTKGHSHPNDLPYESLQRAFAEMEGRGQCWATDIEHWRTGNTR